MQMMNRITPLFSGLVSLNLPGGVTLVLPGLEPVPDLPAA